MVLEIAIVIIAFENDPPAVDCQHGAIVLAPRVVVLGEVVEPRHGDEHLANAVPAERLNTGGDHHATTNPVPAQSVVQLANARDLFGRSAHGSISGASWWSSFAVAIAV